MNPEDIFFVFISALGRVPRENMTIWEPLITCVGNRRFAFWKHTLFHFPVTFRKSTGHLRAGELYFCMCSHHRKKRACQHRWNVTHALIEWHVVERSTRLHRAKVSLENDMFSALIQAPDLYESLCPCSGITEMVDKVPGTWQAITVKSLYLRSVWKQIRSGFAYCGKTHAGAHTPFCGVRFDRRVQSAFA